MKVHIVVDHTYTPEIYAEMPCCPRVGEEIVTDRYCYEVDNVRYRIKKGKTVDLVADVTIKSDFQRGG